MNKIQLYLDTADINEIIKTSNNQDVKGYTTNPSLMKKNKIRSYKKFIEYLCSKTNKPISFEIFSDNENEIYNQAIRISSYGKNIYVKINNKIVIKDYLKDHRVFMTSVIAASVFGGTWNIHDKDSIKTSFPTFLDIVNSLKK